MNKNQNSSFIGLEKLKQKHFSQYTQFVAWADNREWQQFHNNHYDWWMFPINQGSSYGLEYTVYADDVELLKQDEPFIKNYLHGVELLALAWGWDLKNQCLISKPDKNQCWQNWSIRLQKAIMSLLLFGYKTEAKSLLLYAQSLINQNVNLHYRNKDLKHYFIESLNALTK